MTARCQQQGRSSERRRRSAGWLVSVHVFFFLLLPAAHFAGHAHTHAHADAARHGSLAGHGCAVCQALAHNGAFETPSAGTDRASATPEAACPTAPTEAPAGAESVAANGPRAPPLA